MKIEKLKYYSRNEVNHMLADIYLSDDESDIIELCLKGKSIIQIADILCLSPSTVTRRKKEISKKLQNVY